MSVSQTPATAPQPTPAPGPQMVKLWTSSVFAAPFLPAVAIAACWIWWAAADGGYFIRDWAPACIALVLLTFVIAIGSGHALPPGRFERVSLGLLGAFVGFAFLSMLWAGSAAAAWEAADKLVLALATGWALALLPWRRAPATALLAGWALGVAVVGAIALAGVLSDPELGGLASVGRFGAPVGYTNAAAALAWMALFPALLLAYRRDLSVPLQVLGLATADFLLLFGFLPQSRGAVLSLIVVALLFVAVAPDRLRLLTRAVVLGALLLFAFDAISEVQTAADAGRGVSDALDAARARIALTVPIAAVAGLVIALVERWVGREERRTELAQGAGTALVALGCAAALVLALANAGQIGSAVGERLDDLTVDPTVEETSRSRFGSLDPAGRVDAWRVAVDLFEEAPVVGIGAGNFDREHTARRREERHSRYAHNLWLRVLAEAGVVGMLLLAGFLVAAYTGVLRLYRRLDRPTRAVAATCLAVATYFLAQSTLDWLEEFPALLGPGIGLLFVALRLVSTEAPALRPGQASLRVTALVAGGVLSLLAVGALALPYLSSRWRERALAVYRSDPQAAYRDLDRAHAVNPFSYRPFVSEGTIAVYLQDPSRARRAFRRSIEVEDNWYAHLELALLEAQSGRFEAAERELDATKRLNSSDVSVAGARRLVRARRPIDPVRFNLRLLRETQSGFTRPAG